MAGIADQIPGFHVLIGNLPSKPGLLRGCPWDIHPKVPVDRLGESGAVRARGQACASPYIGIAHKLQAVIRYAAPKGSASGAFKRLRDAWPRFPIVHGLLFPGSRAAPCLFPAPGFRAAPGCLSAPGLLRPQAADFLILLPYLIGCLCSPFPGSSQLGAKVRCLLFLCLYQCADICLLDLIFLLHGFHLRPLFLQPPLPFQYFCLNLLILDQLVLVIAVKLVKILRLVH